jgi:CheY-specific phosphatase CheX
MLQSGRKMTQALWHLPPLPYRIQIVQPMKHGTPFACHPVGFPRMCGLTRSEALSQRPEPGNMVVSPQAIEEAGREVLQTTASVAIRGAHQGRVPDRTYDGLIATLSLGGTNGGTVAVCCCEGAAGEVAAGMLGVNAGECEDEIVRDALGEVVNQIGGTIKRKLGVSGDEIQLSVPVVAGGHPVFLWVKSTAEPLSVAFELARGNFWVCFWPAERV